MCSYVAISSLSYKKYKAYECCFKAFDLSPAGGLVWTATMSEDYETFREFVVPMYDFYDMMTARVPMPDLYHTTSKAHSGGWMQARSVVGGYWIKMLSDRMLSK